MLVKFHLNFWLNYVQLHDNTTNCTMSLQVLPQYEEMLVQQIQLL